MSDSQPLPSNIQVLDRLKAREEQRIAETAKRLAELQADSDPAESTETFLKTFNTTHNQLDTELNTALSTTATSLTKDEVDTLATRVNDLERSVAAAAYYLPPYDLRHATNAAAALRGKLDSILAASQPKTKFSFSKKKKKETTAAPDNGTTTPTGAPPTNNDSVNDNSTKPTGIEQQQPIANPIQQQLCSLVKPALSIENLTDQLIHKDRHIVCDQDITLVNLRNCTIWLLAPLAAVFIHGLKNCTVVTGPIAGALYVEDVQDSTLYVASRQVRIHTTTNTDFYLRLLSHPIIEHTTSVRFAPYTPTYTGWEVDFEQQGLVPLEDNGKWGDVQDFNWLRTSKSPNWDVVPESERKESPECVV